MRDSYSLGRQEPGLARRVLPGRAGPAGGFLYDSHARNRVVGQAKSGTQVCIILFQANPKLNYYFVRTVGLEPVQEGWVPAPFVRLKR
ncbi:MAG TPA: hypothetical protein VFS50_15105 [Meiothermus sp.]|nr:hypothetical protein [Meiothermus sp.]